MSVGNEASTELLLNPEQRKYMCHRIRGIRGMEGGKPLFTIDFQNDGEFVGGSNWPNKPAAKEKYQQLDPAFTVPALDMDAWIWYSIIRHMSAIKGRREKEHSRYRHGRKHGHACLEHTNI